MKTIEEIIKESQEHFGVRVFSNDDGISERMQKYAMIEYATEVLKEAAEKATVIARSTNPFHSPRLIVDKSSILNIINELK